jgi:hypothetical protein
MNIRSGSVDLKARRDVGLCSHSGPMGLKVLDRRTIKCAVDDAG